MDEELLKAIDDEIHTKNGAAFIKDWIDTQNSITEVMETVGNAADACMAYNATKAGLDPDRFVINENEEELPGLYVVAVAILSDEAQDDMAVFTYTYDDPASTSKITSAVFVSDGEVTDDNEVNFSVSAEIYREDANGLHYGYDGESWFLSDD